MIHPKFRRPDLARFFLSFPGCGSGLSTAILEQQGHTVVGMDISPSMLDIAISRDDIDGDMMLADMGQGLPYRPGTFDGAVSISALQWLCNADKKVNNPVKRINVFFQKLYPPNAAREYFSFCAVAAHFICVPLIRKIFLFTDTHL
jgi:18S rRNA (guanine1575-N7)-methyltransferase